MCANEVRVSGFVPSEDGVNAITTIANGKDEVGHRVYAAAASIRDRLGEQTTAGSYYCCRATPSLSRRSRALPLLLGSHRRAHRGHHHTPLCVCVCACVHCSRAALGLGETLADRAKALFGPLVLTHKARLGRDPTGLSACAEKPFSFFGIKRKSLVY